MYATVVFGLLFRLLYPTIIVVTGIVLYVILNNKNRPTLLAIAFIIYGVIDIVAASAFFLALMNISAFPRSGWDTASYISMVNTISSIISMVALVIFAVLVIIGVNRILESETIAPAPYNRS